MAALTGLPRRFVRAHSEELQVVRYGRGGRFKAHHDSSAFHPRLLTALFYLNDVVLDAADGGGLAASG